MALNDNQQSQFTQGAPRTTPSLNDQIVPEQIPVGFPWRLFVFSAVILAFSIFVFLGLRFGYRTYLDTNSAALDQRLDTLSKAITPKDREEFINFYSQIVNLKTILDKHPFASNLFVFLERNTIGSVYFTSAEMDVANKELKLQGIALAMGNVAEQLGVFQAAREIQSATLSDVALQANGVSFMLSLVFRPEVLSKPSAL